ncbi:MAG: hypothetical protein H6685_10240 [Deltaproteobacteria bacterium]|nr:hypothetical protein [Deltaproteobacteria bacterium]
MSVTDYLDRLAQISHQWHPDDMAAARLEYFRQYGSVHESEELYEEILKAFMDHYIFERPVPATNVTPLRELVDQIDEQWPDEEAGIYRGFLSARRSLYQITKVRHDGVTLKDLFTGEKIEVTEEVPSGFFKGETWEARVLPFGEHFVFGELLRFHPKRPEKLIAQWAKQIGHPDNAAARALMRRLSLAKLKHTRFPRVDPLDFYRAAEHEPRPGVAETK